MSKRKPPKITDPRSSWIFAPNDVRVVDSFTFTIPHRLADLNEMIRLKGSRWKGAWNKQKIAFEAAVKLAWVTTSVQHGGALQVKGAYTMRYLLLCKDKRTDPSNLFAGAEKVVLDALVSCGAVEGDGFKHHRASSFEATKAAAWGCVVTVEKVLDAGQ